MRVCCAFSNGRLGDFRAKSAELWSLIGASPRPGARRAWLDNPPHRLTEVVAAPGIRPELTHHRLHQQRELGLRGQALVPKVLTIDRSCSLRHQLPGPSTPTPLVSSGVIWWPPRGRSEMGCDSFCGRVVATGSLVPTLSSFC